jgi:hypothetical protein
MAFQMNRFIIHLTHRNTGESKDIQIQAPFQLKEAKKLVSKMFESDEYKVNDIEIVKSVVKIAIEPFCLS